MKRKMNLDVQCVTEHFLDINNGKKKSRFWYDRRRRLYMLLILFIATTIWLFIYYKLLNHSFELPEPLQKLRNMFGDGEVKKRRGREDETQNLNFVIYKNKSKCFTQLKLPKYQESIHVATVACGNDKVQEALVALVSITLTTDYNLYFHIFSDNSKPFENQLKTWPAWSNRWMIYSMYNIYYPSSVKKSQWKKTFKVCATQRLFLSSILAGIDSVIYIDTDVLMFKPIEKLWKMISQMNSNQIIGLAQECETKSNCWYNKYSRNTYFKPHGLNSGVMLMNLTRMRSLNWEKAIVDIYKISKSNLTYGDQDILNIYFEKHPNQVYLLSCSWNYRPDHCLYGNVCLDAFFNGVSLLHGSRDTFLKQHIQHEFFVVFESFKKFRITQGDFQHDVVEIIIQKLKSKSYYSVCAEMLYNTTINQLSCSN
ncbi:glucoside xylosyltransferase 2 [Hydra vulgaris]|uniref:UDP-D-xylose:beta-D-glucoside alpha-1,3-D-xylosyltransferase n=1 Tax=Hydra vulgaris TaxID=6087 RepID=A0ABM4BK43_HYDVU